VSEMLARLRELATQLRPGGDVASRAVKSGIWAGLANVLGRGLQFLKLGVLTWLLTPTQFGLVAYAMLTLSALRRVTNLGINEALIEKPADDVDEFLDVAWTLRLIRGLIVGGVIVLVAPFVAEFFDHPEATNLIRAIAVVPFLKGIENPGIVYFRKDLDFHLDFTYKVGRAAAIVVAAVVAALLLRSAWAIVIGDIVGGVAALAISYRVHDFRPWPALDRETAGELLGYGKWITASGLLTFLINDGDDGFVGWWLGAGALGIYQVAYRFSNAPATEITHVISGVVFPTYAKLQNDLATLRDAFYKTVQLTTFLSFPTAIGIVVVAPVFADTFLREQWATTEMIRLLQVLALWGLLRSLGATTGPLFQAVGRPDYATKIQLGKLLIIVALIVPAAERYGVVGVAAVIVANSLLFSEPIASYVAVRTVEGKLRTFLRHLAYPATGSALMAGTVVAVREGLALHRGVLAFAVLVAVGAVTYAAASLAMDRWLGYDILGLLNSMRSSALSP